MNIALEKLHFDRLNSECSWTVYQEWGLLCGGGALEISARIEEMDIDRLSKEKDSYQVWLDNRIEEAYTIASEAK